MIGRAGRWTQTPSPAKIMKCSFLDYVQLLMISWAGRWTQTPSPAKIMKCSFLDYQLLMISWAGHSPISQPKKWNACFWITFTYWWSWSMDSNPICHPSPAKKMKCSFLDYIQLLMIGQLVHGLNPICHPSAARKMKCSFLDYVQFLMIGQGWLMDLNPIHHPSASKKMKCSFLDYIQLLMIGQAGRCTRTPFATCQKMKCSFLDYIQLLMIGWAGRWTWALCVTSLQPKNWNAHFWFMFNFWWLAGLVDGLKPNLPPLSSQKNEMLVFGLPSTSDDWPGWSMDSNPIYHFSPAKKMKCSFLDYVQLLMIGWAGRWTWALCVTSLQPKKWNAHFWVTFNFWWLAGLVDGLEPHLPPLSSQKN